jgi:hypothetical protein
MRRFSIVALGLLLAGAGLAAAAPESRGLDQALAKRMTLHLSDLPTGWRTEPLTHSGSTCSAIKSVRSHETARAETRFSETPDLAGSVVAVLPTVAEATRTYENITANAQACLLKLPGLKHPSVGTMSFPRFGDGSRAWSLTGTINGFDVYFDVVLVHLRRALALYEFRGVGSHDARFDVRLVRRATGRA